MCYKACFLLRQDRRRLHVAIDPIYLPQKLGPLVKFINLPKLELNYEKTTKKVYKRIQA